MNTLIKVQRVFKDPKAEILNIESDLKNQFDSSVVSFIQNTARQTASYYHDEVSAILLNPIIRLEERLADLSKNPTEQEQSDARHDVMAIFNPIHISSQIQKIVSNKKVYDKYIHFIELVENDSYYNLYQQNSFSEEAVMKFNEFAFVNMEKVIHQLDVYIEDMQRHKDLVKQVQDDQSGRGFLKMGASLLGMGVGIPFLGAGLGLLLGSGDKEKIEKSLDIVFDHVDYVSTALFESVEKVGESLYLLFLTLFSGTFLAVNKSLLTKNARITHISSSHDISYGLVPAEIIIFEKWFSTSLIGIEKLAQKKCWQDAIIAIKKMQELINQTPFHAQHIISDKKSALYIAHVHYFALYQEALLYEYRAGHTESYIKNGEKFFSTLILFPLEKDMPSYASSITEFVFQFIKAHLKNTGELLPWFRYKAGYIEERRRVSHTLSGEMGVGSSDYAKNIQSFLIGDQFYLNYNNLTPIPQGNPLAAYMKYLKISDIEKLIEIDNALEEPDALTLFLEKLLLEKQEAKRTKRLIYMCLAVGLTALTIWILFFMLS